MTDASDTNNRSIGQMLDRRRFLQASAAAGVGAASLSASTASAAHDPAAPEGRAPKNVIFAVADGMSTGTLTLADMAIRHRTGRPSNWVALFDHPRAHRASCSTHSADSLVTDSAAAGSAWGIGEKVNNGAICFTPDNREPTPILVRARAGGLATGLVTTTRVTHATPAAFIANVPKRSMEREIAAQIMERRVDVVLGGGADYFSSDLLDAHPDATVVRTAAELNAARSNPGRLVGLFKGGHMSFDVDRPDHEPTLRAMSEVALDRLASHEHGFVLQIEGGRVDHAAHENDAGALLADQIAFDDALGAAIDFTASRDDTLLIITSDHGNANPGLTLYGEGGTTGFDRLMNVRHSYAWISEQFAVAASRAERAAKLPELIGEAVGTELATGDIEWINQVFGERQRASGFRAMNGFGPALGAILANYVGVSFISPNHTADFVEVTAMGPGSEKIPAMVDNIDLHQLMRLATDR